MKKVKLGIVLCFMILVMGRMNVYATTSLSSSDIASYMNGKVGQSYPNGMCLAFVADCFQNMGAARSSTCCASNYGNKYIIDRSRDDIPVGADVFFGNCGGGPCRSCGSSYYGHIGVYVGNRYFVHATGGKVYKTSIDSDYWRNRYRGWGYHGNISVMGTSVESPSNPQISKSSVWYDLGDTISVSAHADNATGYDLAMFKDDVKIVGEKVVSGTYTLPANRFGVGHYTFYFSCSNASGSVDTKWLEFDVVDKPGYKDVSVSKDVYHVSETVSISVSTVCAKGQVIGIDKNGVERVVTTDCDSTYTIDASKLGKGNYSAYFSIYNGSGSIDTKRVNFSITDSAPNNPVVTKSQEWFDLKDTVTLNVSAKGATGYYMSMYDSKGKLRVGTRVDSGQYSIAAKELGIGEYSAYFSCENSSGVVDSQWITFGVVGKPTYKSVDTLKKVYNLSDTVEISVSTICAKGQVIGIDKNGTTRVVTKECDNPYKVKASDLGVGNYSAYFSVYNGSGSTDTKRVDFQIANVASDPVDLGDKFYAYIKHQGSGLYVTNQQRNIACEEVSNGDNQIWEFTKLDNGSYKIASKLDGYYMEAYGASDEDETNIATWPEYDGGANQQFYVYKIYGAYYLRPAHSVTRVLDMASDNKNIAIWGTGEDWNPQKFEIKKVQKPQFSFEEEWGQIDYGVETYINPLTTDSDGVITYKSSDEEIADVDVSGKVTIKGSGTVTITAEIEATSEYLPETAEYKLTINPHDISYMDVEIEPAKYTGEALTGKITVSAGELTLIQDKDYTVIGNYETNPGEYKVTVEGIGNYTGTAEGKFVITKGEAGITIPKSTIEKTYGDEAFSLNAISDNGDTLRYASSDETTAAVDESGKVSILKAGQIEITVQSKGNDYYESCEKKITLNINHAKAEIDASSISVPSGSKDFALDVSCNSDAELSFRSDNTDIITVDRNGTVHLVAESGSANITISAGKTEKYEQAEKTITVTVQAPDHNYTGKVTKAATCTESGTKTFTCSDCDDTYTEEIPALGHQYSDWQVTTLSTCMEEGVETRTCSSCGQQEERSVEMSEHTYDNKTIEATCTQSGYTLHTCIDCGTKYKDSYTNVLGHNIVIDSAVDATCIEKGKTAGRHCSVCGTVITRQQEIAALGHDYNDGEIIKEATCTTDGKKNYTCSVCGETKTETIEATGHDLVIDKAVASTCISEGKTAGIHCSVCGEVLQKQETIRKTDHTLSTVGDEIEATCTEEGKTSGSKCSVCGEVIEEQKVVPALGHDVTEVVTKANVEKDGKIEEKCSRCGKITKTTIITAPKSLILESDSFVYNGEVQKPTVKVVDDGGKEIASANYEVSYSKESKEAGEYTVTVTFKGNYSGKLTKGYNIVEKNDNSECKHEYASIVTKATTKADGKVEETCKKCGKIISSKVIAFPQKATLRKVSLTYNGKIQKPNVIVTGSDGKEISSSNYTVSFAKKSKMVGRYALTIIFKGNYSGKLTTTYDIVPKGTKITKLTAKSKGIAVKWKKQTSQTTGYEIQYSTNKKFKGAGSVKIKKATLTLKKVGKLKAKKKYYVRIRTYRTVKFNGKSVKVYSKWSAAKKAVTKK